MDFRNPEALYRRGAGKQVDHSPHFKPPLVFVTGPV